VVCVPLCLYTIAHAAGLVYVHHAARGAMSASSSISFCILCHRRQGQCMCPGQRTSYSGCFSMEVAMVRQDSDRRSCMKMYLGRLYLNCVIASEKRISAKAVRAVCAWHRIFLCLQMLLASLDPCVCPQFDQASIDLCASRL
jgi:hypothetical protein